VGSEVKAEAQAKGEADAGAKAKGEADAEARGHWPIVPLLFREVKRKEIGKSG